MLLQANTQVGMVLCSVGTGLAAGYIGILIGYVMGVYHQNRSRK